MRRKTSRVRSRKNQRQIQLQVRSSRILGFEILRGAKQLAKLAFVLALLGGAVWGVREGLDRLFIQNEEFQIKVVDLQTNGSMTAQHFAELTAIDPQASIFAVKMGEVSEKLRERPGITEVKVSRRLPGTLRVEIRERIPVAWIECRRLGIMGKDPRTGVLVDADGVCFPCEKWWEESAASLPVVMVRKAEERDFAIGKELRHREAVRGLALLEMSRRFFDGSPWSLPVVGVKNDYSLVAVTNTGAEVTFAMYGHERQMQDLLAVLKHVGDTKREIATVNLIPERNVPVTYGAPAAGGELPAERLAEKIRAIVNRG